MPPFQEGPAEEEDAIIERRLRSAVTFCHFWLKVAGAVTLAGLKVAGTATLAE